VKQHIQNSGNEGGSCKNSYASKHLGQIEVVSQAAGVSLIVSGRRNSIHNILAALSASIAAGNITVLATIEDTAEDEFLSLLSRLWPRYLNSGCLFFVAGVTDFDLDERDVDLVTIYGE
jgi:hypothetical protein